MILFPEDPWVESPPRERPNERVDALARAQPRPLTAADRAKGIVGRYEYTPATSRRSR
jgi:hypothetical protein